ncbi:type II toxin-antitoxin system RelE/ParE family toxin [Mucilaginibacter aquariorum]|uniref:Type II toxin-antitoxin system RelE/ParE family toxin n=1 Tax=Mucilaginibacter aquariorum TaxID=2967225 RepID=A0ABT1T6D7_9SPHI|nr:type II toxin-antitoxin system RelE/ParE family toxin [Mucilaginibacter aquariorum]MCQ6960147.1 type II toxin-antitoxin system RelE/ParE family toxin [Mucilaginibacter aquariorum]
MAKEVILTPLAKSNIDSIVNYLINNWSAKVAKHFLFRLEKVFVLLSEAPEIYTIVNKNKGIRRSIVTKHNTLYFIETSKNIKVLSIFDSRQNPDKLKKII